MELNKFVSTTIKEIIDGVIEAQEYAKDKGSLVNPQHTRDGILIEDKTIRSYRRVNEIKFDLVVIETVSDKA